MLCLQRRPKVKPKEPITFDRGRVDPKEELVFRTNLDRCRYFGTRNALRPKWREENEDNWRFFTLDERAQASQQPSLEGPVQAAAQLSAPISARNLHDDEKAADDPGASEVAAPSSLDQPESDAPPPSDVDVPLLPQGVEVVIIGSDRCVGSDHAALILGWAPRTFSRRKAELGPPKTKLGNKAYYKLETILAMAASKKFPPTRP
jgi:hypothetical protein